MAKKKSVSVIACEVLYTGRVQGVGFRVNAQQISRRFAVVGTVRNLPDGRVELLAEGADDEVQRFLAAIAASMDLNIQHITVTSLPPKGSFSRFEIRG